MGRGWVGGFHSGGWAFGWVGGGLGFGCVGGIWVGGLVVAETLTASALSPKDLREQQRGIEATQLLRDDYLLAAVYNIHRIISQMMFIFGTLL